MCRIGVLCCSPEACTSHGSHWQSLGTVLILICMLAGLSALSARHDQNPLLSMVHKCEHDSADFAGAARLGGSNAKVRLFEVCKVHT